MPGIPPTYLKLAYLVLNLGQSTANDVSLRHCFQRESWKLFPIDFVKPCFWAPSSPCSACVPFFIHPLCLNVSIKKEPGIVLSLLPIVPPPTFTRAAILNQFLSRPSAFWMRLNTAMIFSFLFWFFDIYVLCHLFHHPQPSSTTSLLAESKYVFTLTISLSHCRVSKFKHWSSNIHFYFW